ncbi:hypothetical protein OIU78_005289 [Salix suchowensis]|nr:hypothetical protein OIU78_005289 [Salix suchowensis]
MWGAKPLANRVKPPRIFFCFDDFFSWIACNAFLFISSMLLFSCAYVHTKMLTCSGNHAGGCAWTRLWSLAMSYITQTFTSFVDASIIFKIFWSSDHNFQYAICYGNVVLDD